MPNSDIIILFLGGIFGGFLGGLLGIGGGIIFVLVLPALLIQLGIPVENVPQFTIANSLFATAISAFSSTLTYRRIGLFFPKQILSISAISMVVAALILLFFVNTPFYSPFIFNLVFMFLLSFMAAKTLITKETAYEPQHINLEFKPSMLATAGTLTGIVSPLSGLGGGAILIPLLNSIYKLPIRVGNSISIGVVAFTALSTTLLNLLSTPPVELNPDLVGPSMGYVVFQLAIPLSAGVLIGAPLGVKAVRKVSGRYIRILFVIFLLTSMTKKIVDIYMGGM